MLFKGEEVMQELLRWRGYVFWQQLESIGYKSSHLQRVTDLRLLDTSAEAGATGAGFEDLKTETRFCAVLVIMLEDHTFRVSHTL